MWHIRPDMITKKTKKKKKFSDDTLTCNDSDTTQVRHTVFRCDSTAWSTCSQKNFETPLKGLTKQFDTLLLI